MKQKIKINVLGSCISRVSLLDGVQSEHGIADDRLELGYFLDKQNIVAAMMPPAFTKEEVQAITVDELYDKSRLQSLKQTLNKETLNLLLESDADYLVMDFYDMGIMFLSYKIHVWQLKLMSFVVQIYLESIRTKCINGIYTNCQYGYGIHMLIYSWRK